MCSNYVSVSQAERLLQFFGVTRESKHDSIIAWPTGLAPFVRLAEPGSGNRVANDGHFGLIPGFTKEIAYGRKTYNARSETVHQKLSFRDAWRRAQRCIVPVEALYEPNYESGKAVRWSIYQAGFVPMGVAGIYTRWIDKAGEEKFSFAMLTVNADTHPFYNQFHKPGEEKRMPIILDPKDHDEWLRCSVTDASKFFRMWMGPLEGEPAPLPPRPPSASRVQGPRPPPPIEQPGLF